MGESAEKAMLPQLVGLSCGACGERIGSEIDGRFCEGCGNPIHNRCANGTGPAPSTAQPSGAQEQLKCSRCGCALSAPVAERVRAVREAESQLPVLRPYLMWRKTRLWCFWIAIPIFLYVAVNYALQWEGDWKPLKPLWFLYSYIGVAAMIFAGFAYWRERQARAAWLKSRQNEPPG